MRTQKYLRMFMCIAVIISGLFLSSQTGYTATSISGKVEDNSGSPIPYADCTISVYYQSDWDNNNTQNPLGEPAPATTNFSGEYVISSLPATDFLAVVCTPPNNEYPAKVMTISTHSPPPEGFDFFFPGCDAGCDPSVNPGCTPCSGALYMSGKVEDVNGSPVPGCLVEVFKKDPLDTNNYPPMGSDTTKDDGTYWIEPLPAESDLRIVCHPPDPMLQEQFYDNKTSLADANSVSTLSGPKADINFILAFSGTDVMSISGSVKDSSSNPVTNCWIEVFHNNMSIANIENTVTGNFIIYNLPSVSNLLIKCYPPPEYLQAEASVSTLNQPEPIVFTLQSLLSGGKSISGVIKNQDGFPIAGCRIEIHHQSGLLGVADSDTNGNYTVSGLPSQEGLLVVCLPPPPTDVIPVYHHQFWDHKSDWMEATAISTLDGTSDPLTQINFNLEKMPANGIQGVVKFNNQPVAQTILVDVFAPSIDFHLGVWTKPDDPDKGTYTARGLPPANDYQVRVWKDDNGMQGEFYYYLPQGIPGTDIPTSSTTNIDEATKLTAPTESVLTKIDLIVNFESGSIIEGHVYQSDDSTGVENVWVNACPSNATGYCQGAVTDSTGAYKIWGLDQSQSFRLETHHPDYPGMIKEDIVAGSTNINFSLSTGFSISGTVLDANGNSISGTKVEAWSASYPGEMRQHITTGDGSYTIIGLKPAADYKVGIFPDNSPPVFYDGQRILDLAKYIDLTEKNQSGIDFQLVSGGKIKGTISGVPTDELVAMRVEAHSEKAKFGAGTVPGPDGHYEIIGLLEESDYIISVRHQNYPPVFYKTGSAPVPDWENATKVPPSDTPRDFNFSSFTFKSIQGSVTFNSKFIGDIQVTAVSNTGIWRDAVTAWSSATQYNNYVITGLPAGIYMVTVHPEHFAEQTAVVTISGNNKTQNFTLIAATTKTISGSITNLEKDKKVRVFAWSESTHYARESNEITGIGFPVTYQIQDLKPAADYRVELISEEHPPFFYNQKVNRMYVDLVDLTQSDATTIHFNLPKASKWMVEKRPGCLLFLPPEAGGEPTSKKAVIVLLI